MAPFLVSLTNIFQLECFPLIPHDWGRIIRNMKIIGIKVENYKSFRETQWLEFGAGFNAIVGKNNVGKTALLEAISTQMLRKPHLSPATMPNPHSIPKPTSIVHTIFQFSGIELIDSLKRNKSNIGKTLHFPFPQNIDDKFIENFINNFHNLQEIKIESVFYDGTESRRAHLWEYMPIEDGIVLGKGKIPSPDQFINFSEIQRISKNQVAMNKENSLASIVNMMRDRIYSFRAERLNIGVASSQPSETLDPSAGNLPSVLNTLQLRTPSRFKRYLDAVQIVFPNITQVTVPQLPSNQVEIRIWENDPSEDRDDLAMPLTECGTGISQVLAMLYVVLNSDDPRVIIIDEPQSFLHPGAVRKLFDIFRLKSFGGRPLPEHQYIISTHSPVAITAANPSSILLVTKDGAESKVESIDINETNQVRLYLQEIGASLSDVFGAEQILWVEGKTEEQCFPLILTGICQRQLFGTAIVGLVHTGDFNNKKDRKLALQVYERLSSARGILPPALGFVFDKEDLDTDGMKDFERVAAQFNVPVHFSGRRMYENYLINSTAIVYVLTSLGLHVSVESVDHWINENRWSPRYVRGHRDDQSMNTWLMHVDGAEFMRALFRDFSGNTHEYDKVSHGIQLTKWLIQNSPEDLQEMAELIIKALKLD